MANLKLENVSKIYPSGALALYKINLELPDSQFIAVVGGEKSGKTSLLRVISGMEEVTEGTEIGFTVSKGKKEEEPDAGEEPDEEKTYYYADY